MTNMNKESRAAMERILGELENRLDSDILGLFGPIISGVDQKTRDAVESLTPRRNRLTVVLSTGGGVVEVVERMVDAIRHFYKEVSFAIPDKAMSAGTVFVMSGDEIMMDYFSCLGPIDPQLPQGEKLIPALSYLVQYDRLIAKAKSGQLTEAEFLLLKGFDLAELHQFEMARDLSKSLLIRWLATYKFKDWNTTETHNRTVSQKDKEQRAQEIADALLNNERWGSHGRGIPMKVIQGELNLRVKDFGEDPTLQRLLRSYHSLSLDYGASNNFHQLTHSRGYL